ncbi:MAG: hypothetical protein AAGD08_15600, partial [Pseudomonadota bacterium]
LQKAHDYYGKAKTLYGHMDKIKKAADMRPGDVDALRELAGLKDKEVKKLIDTLEKRAKAAEETAKASFPPVEAKTFAAWARWAKALEKDGENSKQANAARADYLKALQAYDYALRERITYCDIVIKVSGKQVKVYQGLSDIYDTTYKILTTLLKLPEVKGVSHHAAAFSMYLKFEGVGPRAKRIVKAHNKIIANAKAHKTAMEKLKKENDVWIADVGKSVFTGMLKQAMKAFGIKVPA